MTIETLDQDIQKALKIKPAKTNQVKYWDSKIPCNHETLKRLEKPNKKGHPLLEKSVPFDLISILDIFKDNKPLWHVTPAMSRKLAAREAYQEIWTGNGEKYRWSIAHPALTIDSPKFNFNDVNRIFTPSPVPLIPRKAEAIIREIHGYTRFFTRDLAEYIPLILYKPDTWQVEYIDPAVVARVQGKWRVFAIWGDIVEQAELITFSKGQVCII